MANARKQRTGLLKAKTMPPHTDGRTKHEPHGPEYAPINDSRTNYKKKQKDRAKKKIAEKSRRRNRGA